MNDKIINIDQITRFLLVGLSNTVVGYLSYLMFILVLSNFEIKYDYIIAGVLSFIVGVQWAFVFNKIFVFENDKSQTTIKTQLIKSYLMYGFSGLILNNILLVIFVDICHASKYYAPIFCLLFTVPFNFFVNKYWIFK